MPKQVNHNTTKHGRSRLSRATSVSCNQLLFVTKDWQDAENWLGELEKEHYEGFEVDLVVVCVDGLLRFLQATKILANHQLVVERWSLPLTFTCFPRGEPAQTFDSNFRLVQKIGERRLSQSVS